MMIKKKIKFNLKSVNYLFLRYVFFKKYLKVKINILNSEIKCHAKDVIGRHLYKYQNHEIDNTYYLLNNFYLNSGEVAVDIGANIGWFSILLNRVSSPDARIFSFEPNQNNYALLVENLHQNKCNNVEAVAKAVSEKNGASELYIYPEKNSGRHSLLHSDGLSKTVVDTVALNNFFEEDIFRRVKFIKLDIEGFEYFALMGASKLLEFAPLVMMELSPNLYRDNAGVPEIVSFMYEHSFKAYKLSANMLSEIPKNKLLKINYQTDIFWKKTPNN